MIFLCAVFQSESLRKDLFIMERVINLNTYQPKQALYRGFQIIVGRWPPLLCQSYLAGGSYFQTCSVDTEDSILTCYFPAGNHPQFHTSIFTNNIIIIIIIILLLIIFYNNNHEYSKRLISELAKNKYFLWVRTLGHWSHRILVQRSTNLNHVPRHPVIPHVSCFLLSQVMHTHRHSTCRVFHR